MAELSVKIAGVEFKNPVIAASGCFGFGEDYEELYPVERLGGISLKGTTLEPRPGNPPVRIAETPSGILNSVGLQNPGVDALVRDHLPRIKDRDTVIIANIAGGTVESCCEAVERACVDGIDMIELNISCPNVREGGIAFGVREESVKRVVGEVRRVCTKPLIVKLSPNVTDIVSIAKTAEAAGADALSLINTLLGMRIDIKTRRPVLHNNMGGLSGPAVFPVALRMVWQTAHAVKIPVIGLGGVASWQNAVEMLLAGACAVQVGTAMFTDPMAPLDIIEGLGRWMDENGIVTLEEIVGKAEIWK